MSHQFAPCSTEPHAPHWDEHGACPGALESDRRDLTQIYLEELARAAERPRTYQSDALGAVTIPEDDA